MTTKIYQVWDHDPMDGSMGRDYLAETYTNKANAQAEVKRRNEAWKAYWIKATGTERLNETWNWKHARMTISEVK